MYITRRVENYYYAHHPFEAVSVDEHRERIEAIAQGDRQRAQQVLYKNRRRYEDFLSFLPTAEEGA